MARISYLLRRGASYYARAKVPLDLVEALGKRELVKALGTKDESEAKKRLWPIVQAWTRQFEEARSRRALTEDDKADAVWQHYTEGLDRDEAVRRRLPTGEAIEAAKLDLVERIERDEVKVDTRLAEIAAVADVAVLADARSFDETSRRAKLATLRDHMASGETALIDDEAEAYIEKHKLLVDPASDDGRDLARRLMRAEIEKLERTLERDRGDYAGTPRDSIVKPPIGTAREVAAPGETIMELFEKYARQNPKGIKVDTLNQARRDIGTFLDLHGSTLPAHRIDKKGVAAWIDLLMVYPVKATETKAFEGMTFPQIIRANERVGKPVLSPRTVNRYLAGLGAFCDWLVRRGVLDANPTEGLSLAKQKRKGDPTFSTDQMVTLFQSPLFVGCESGAQPRYYSKPGPTLIRDFRYWVPLVMLYSGARPGEIAQLLCSDVRPQDGVWIMHITELGDDDKSLKTGSSTRVVPIHSELIRLGFLAYHERMVKAKERKLFPTAERNSRGQMIADFSRDFGRYLTKLGIKNGRGLSLYSFRHGAMDALRRAGHLNSGFRYLVGHEKDGVTGMYGVLPQGTLKQRSALIEEISYPGLSLEHLMPPQPS